MPIFLSLPWQEVFLLKVDPRDWLPLWWTVLIQDALLAGHQVEQGLEGTVEAGQAPAHLVGNVDVLSSLCARPLQLPASRQQIEVSEDVVGEEADAEEDHNENHQSDASPEAEVHGVVSAEHHHHVAVASDDDEEGDDKPSDGDGCGVWQENAQALMSCCVVALHPLVIHLAEGKIWSNLHGNPQPEHSAEPRRGGHCLAPAPCLRRVHDAQVVVDADAGEEADAGVEVEVEEALGDPAPAVPEEPQSAPQVVADEEGQCADVQQVSQAQIAHQQPKGVVGAMPNPEAEVA